MSAFRWQAIERSAEKPPLVAILVDFGWNLALLIGFALAVLYGQVTLTIGLGIMYAVAVIGDHLDAIRRDIARAALLHDHRGGRR